MSSVPSVLRPRRAVAVLACALAVAACGGKSREPAAPKPAAAGELAYLKGQRVVLLPVSALAGSEGLDWAAALPNRSDYLRALDDEIVFAAREHRTGVDWIFPEAVARAARRAPGVAPDPYQLSMDPLRPGGITLKTELGEPLASQIRSLAALHDARFVLAPVELRFERVGDTDRRGRGVLHVALIDARLSKAVFSADVASDTTAALTPAVAASIAGHLIDLTAAK